MSLSVTSTASATGNPRNKTALKPGRSLMDWVRLGQSGKDLAGTSGRLLDVSQEELKKHNKLDDAWMAINGLVYNVTPYFEYHPGGIEELMRGAGIDATNLFNEVHKWVNVESMLAKCLIGKLVPTLLKPWATNGLKPTRAAPSNPEINSADFLKPVTAPVAKKSLPTFDWFQTPEVASLCIYTRSRNVQPSDIVFSLTGTTVKAHVNTECGVFAIHLTLEAEVIPKCIPKILTRTGKVEFLLTKYKKELWSCPGVPKPSHCQIVEQPSVKATLSSRTRMTHDSWLYTVTLPQDTCMVVPIGGHVTLGIETLDGSAVSAKYTPVLESILGENSVPDREKKLHFLIKTYRIGKFTPKLENLQMGDNVFIGIPESAFEQEKLLKCQRLCFLAAGTGITPMIRLINVALTRELERKVDLHFWNKTEEDMLYLDEFADVAQKHKRFTVTNILTQAKSKSSSYSGRASMEYLRTAIGESSPGLLVCVCGPLDFTTSCIKFLMDLGHPDSSLHAFLG